MVDYQVIIVRPYEIKNAEANTSEPSRISSKHPGAKREEITIAFLVASSMVSSINHVPVRLYPEGFGAVLLTTPHQCNRSKCAGPESSVNIPIRLVVFNWQRGVGLGVSGQV
jgi:hypothetical protein